MNVNYKGYLKGLLKTKGFSDWQYLFTDIDLDSKDHEDLHAKLKKSILFFAKNLEDFDSDYCLSLLNN